MKLFVMRFYEKRKVQFWSATKIWRFLSWTNIKNVWVRLFRLWFMDVLGKVSKNSAERFFIPFSKSSKFRETHSKRENCIHCSLSSVDMNVFMAFLVSLCKHTSQWIRETYKKTFIQKRNMKRDLEKHIYKFRLYDIKYHTCHVVPIWQVKQLA